MLTVEQENYLKTVLTLGGDRDYISNKSLVQSLSVKPSSVTEMMQRLVNLGYLESRPYKGTKLTAEGYEHTLLIIRRHRLIEKFLIKELGYDWQEVHAEAEVLEHHVSDHFIERLDKHLGYPATCPHGGVIPRTERFEEIYQQNLLSAQVTDIVTVKRVVDTETVLTYLTDCDITIGDQLEIISLAGDVIVRKRNRNKQLKREIAENIYVE